MTVYELISQYNIDRPNQIKEETLERWLKDLEIMVVQDVILKHCPLPKKLSELLDKQEREKEPDGVIHIGVKKPPKFDIDEYFSHWDSSSELLIESPYTQVYMDYLDMKTAWSDNETQRYNAASAMFNGSYLGFQQYYNRTYKPIGAQPVFIDHTRL